MPFTSDILMPYMPDRQPVVIVEMLNLIAMNQLL